MRQIGIYIIFILICSVNILNAQVLTSLDKGISVEPLVSLEHDGLYTTLQANEAGGYYTSSWNGSSWVAGSPASDVIKHENSSGKTTRVHAAAGGAGDLYFLISQRNSPTDQFKYYVLRNSGNTWTDITDQTLSDAVELYEILIYGGVPVIIAKNNKNTPANIFYYESGKWVPKGNNLTPDQTKDYIVDAAVFGDKIFMTGVFTKIGSSDKRYMAEWNGEQWNFVNFPPFALQAYRFGAYKNQLVLHGKPATGNESIRIYNGSGWQDMSSGLDKITIQTIHNFAWNKEMLWAVGSFESSDQSSTSNLMYYHPERGWLLANNALNAFDIFLGQYKDKAIVNGNFIEVYGTKFNYTAEISGFHAIISGRFYDDVNGNCFWDVGEKDMSSVTFILKPGDHYFSTNTAGEFSIPVMPGNYSIIPVPDKNREFKCNPLFIQVKGFETISAQLIGLKYLASRSDAAVRLFDYSGWKVTSDIPNQYRLCARNVGTVTLDAAKLIFFLPKELEQFSFSPLPDFLDLSRAEWRLDKILVNGEYCVDISAVLKSDADKSKPVKLSAKVEISGNQDLDPGDNEELLQQEWVKTISQNSKSTSLNGTYNSDDEPLHYRIAFQNQMIGVAERIRITDTLDENICIGARGIIENTSHSSALSYHYILLPDGRYQYILNWDFKDIHLPDSATDFLKSQGFVDLKIFTDMRFMKQGADICNRAQLYFNNNEPFSTNVVCNEIDVTGSANHTYNRLKVFPNPAQRHLNVDFNSNKSSFVLMNQLGISVLKGDLVAGMNSIDLQGIIPGIYLLKVDGFVSERVFVSPSR